MFPSFRGGGINGKKKVRIRVKLNKRGWGKLLSVFSYGVRLALGCIFLYSSLGKIRQPYDFLSSIYDYELVGPKLGMFIGMALPWLELLVGVCLTGGIFVGGALLTSIEMSVMFTFVLGWALCKGIEISCGCFGASYGEIISFSTLIRACVILLFSIIGYAYEISRPLDL